MLKQLVSLAGVDKVSKQLNLSNWWTECPELLATLTKVRHPMHLVLYTFEWEVLPKIAVIFETAQSSWSR